MLLDERCRGNDDIEDQGAERLELTGGEEDLPTVPGDICQDRRPHVRGIDVLPLPRGHYRINLHVHQLDIFGCHPNAFERG